MVYLDTSGSRSSSFPSWFHVSESALHREMRQKVRQKRIGICFIRHYKLQRDGEAEGWTAQINVMHPFHDKQDRIHLSVVFYTLWNSPLVLPWIQWLQVCCNVQNKNWGVVSICNIYVYIYIDRYFDALRSPSVQIWTIRLWWELYIAQRLGNSIQGTGIDSDLWLTFPGEVVKSLDSEVILGYTWINYWLFHIYIYIYIYIYIFVCVWFH